VAAQKALSCIYRTGQRFGAAHLTDVLLGKDTARIRQFGHDQVSTHGIGKELSADQWKSVYRQLVAAGLAAVDVEGYGGLRLTEAGRPVLRGEQPCGCDSDPKRSAPNRPRAARQSIPDVAQTSPEAQALWERLRERRRELAVEQSLRPT
jgi:ATP-dependent DNA helicase RecQ